jgi:hypothetical protein
MCGQTLISLEVAYKITVHQVYTILNYDSIVLPEQIAHLIYFGPSVVLLFDFLADSTMTLGPSSPIITW